jgi:hypothetical protein
MNPRLFSVLLLYFIFCNLNLIAQRCDYWSEPVALSDSLEDNRNPFVVRMSDEYTYLVFWERTLDLFGSEIVYTEYYDIGAPETVVLAEGYTVSNPQVIPVWNWYPQTDTLAIILYQTDQNGNDDIYYTVMTDAGFTEPVPFANSEFDEKHLRVSRSGGMVWQEGDVIKYSRMYHNSSGYFFEPATVIEEGNCMDPVIQTGSYYEQERFISWEKGYQGNAQVWYVMWNYQTGEWDDPALLFDDGTHSNLRSASGFEYFGWAAILLSDWQDSDEYYHISAYDLDEQYELVSEFTQQVPFQPDLFTVDFITQDYLGFGYFAFRHDEGLGNSDVFSTDWPDISPWFSAYCRLDSTVTFEDHPMLFQAADYGWHFDLVCIWESFRNGHRQLFTNKTDVVYGGVPEPDDKGAYNVRIFPNPSSGQTTLEFEMTSPGAVKLSIFNHLGQEIYVPADGWQDEGKHQIIWDAGKYPAGIYHYRITANGKRQTGKLQLCGDNLTCYNSE